MISRCSRQPLYPRGVFSLRPSGPSPSPTAFPRTPEAWLQGRCLADRPIDKRRKTVHVRTIRGLRDVTGAGPGRGGGGGPRGMSRGTRRRRLSQPAAGRERRRVLPIGRDGRYPAARARPHRHLPRPGPTACECVPKCRTACFSEDLCSVRTESFFRPERPAPHSRAPDAPPTL